MDRNCAIGKETGAEGHHQGQKDGDKKTRTDTGRDQGKEWRQGQTNRHWDRQIGIRIKGEEQRNSDTDKD